MSLSGISINSITMPSSVIMGKTAVATPGTRVQLDSSTTLLKSGVTIKAVATNTDKVLVGDSIVDSTNGYRLGPADTVFLEIATLATVYVDAIGDPGSVTYIAS